MGEMSFTPDQRGPGNVIVNYFSKNSVETNIILIACITGVLFSAYGLGIDLYKSASLVLILRDIIAIVIFGAFIFLVYKGKDNQWTKGVFSVLFIILLTLSFNQTGIVNGYGKFDALGSLIFLIMINRGLLMWIFPAIFFGVIIYLLYDPHPIPITQAPHEHSMVNFWICCLGLSALVYYIKHQYDQRKARLLEVHKALESSNLERMHQNKELRKVKKELNKANEKLNKRISKRTVQLNKRKEMIMEYVNLNTEEILPPLKNTIMEINTLKKPVEKLSSQESQLFDLLQHSGSELDLIYETIKKSLIEEGKLSRYDIREKQA